MAGSTMPDWSAGEGQTKQHPGPPGWGLGMSPPFSTFKTRLATEIPARELQEIPYLGEEGSSVRRKVKSSGESLRYLEATGWNWLSLSRDTTRGTRNLRTMFLSGKAAQVGAEVQHSSAWN